MYPFINRYLRLLHERGISSFLVTNAQFPERVQQLEPCTQLYLSIDAATAASLKAIDRPLFSDFWPRFLACLAALRQKRQRTVYRLTLVKVRDGRRHPHPHTIHHPRPGSSLSPTHPSSPPTPSCPIPSDSCRPST